MAVIKKYKALVKQVFNPLPGVYTVIFSGSKKFNYLPGQFLHIALDEYDGVAQWPESRCFSMQSSPDDEFLKITFSVKGRFTSRMADEMRVNKEVWLKLPYGDIFNRGNCLKNCVFIAGGTGITPFLSLFNHSQFAEYLNPKLYLGLRSSRYDIFENEIKEVQRNHLNFKVNLFFEDVDGILDIKNIFEENNDVPYFISGPPVMIRNFKYFLLENGVLVKNIITDDWE